ncbi:hypothetical protein [Fontibacillus sp. BL9]|uniref:hypothetical protein n=1 Tax=Fontibacillus sp. BL9 TaxID=3389971 RepID=UPI0039785DA6
MSTNNSYNPFRLIHSFLAIWGRGYSGSTRCGSISFPHPGLQPLSGFPAGLFFMLHDTLPFLGF